MELESKIDPSKPMDEKTQRLRKMTVLFLDAGSMIDDGTWWALKEQLTTVAETPLQDVPSQAIPPLLANPGPFF